eukprot:TRINITY_DN93193_c0_g1_i1.p1 TRINITY_DN93193_c0_g1~~TRINITY_DN93193_c0_g1_i1.p1  ORF type:complete len:695 (-),score=177.21 TRINITY_DN93193_c0_g1_i1:33-2018(-)
MASAEGGYPAGAEPKAKAKQPRPPPPPPPPAVATAALLIRGAAARVLGLKLAAAGGDLQPIWVNEPGCSKVTVSADDSSRSPFPKEDQYSALVDAVEAETNRLGATAAPIAVFEMDRADAEAKYGTSIYDPSSKKPERLRLAHLPGVALLEIPSNWALCGNTADCGEVTFLVKEVEKDSKKKPDTLIFVKGKKKQFVAKYSVANAEAAASEGGEAPDSDAAKALSEGSVRVEVVGVDTAVEAPKTTQAAAEASAEEVPEGEMVVDPWSVKGKIDYDKLIREFGSARISPELLSRIEKLTVGKGRVPRLHSWLRRSIFFSHREMEAICALQEKGCPFYLYTGRGPNSLAMHLGHLLPFMFTKWLQEAFDVPLVIQMTDDEKFLWKGEYDPEKGDNLDHFRYLTVENAKDIIACGFDKKKTFIFSDCEYVGQMYPNIVRIWKAITYSTAKGAFGFAGESNIGQSAFPAIQAAPSFSSSFHVPLGGDPNIPCLIPCAIDQDPYFRVTRDIAHKLVPKDHPLKGKPSLIHCKFFPPLQGAEGKMSSSDPNCAIFLTDSPEDIERKIKSYAFSGGRQTAKEQREKGANLDIDVSYQWLTFFLEDDEELAKIEKEYGTGTGDYWNTGAVKEKLTKVLQEIVKKHQERRAKITDEEVAEWMATRKLTF